MSDHVIFNYALLLDAKFSAELIETSRIMNERHPLEYSLGERSHPHVTILQFPGRRNEANALWDKLSRLEVPPLRLDFHGLAFERWRDWDGIWLRLRHCGPLRELQASARRVLEGRQFVNGLDDAYEPHATLAAWPKAERMPGFDVPYSIMDRVITDVRPALGVSGPQFQFSERLF